MSDSCETQNLIPLSENSMHAKFKQSEFYLSSDFSGPAGALGSIVFE